MRLSPVSKYKLFHQSQKVVVLPFLRLLKFKRTKWKVIQEIIKKRIVPLDRSSNLSTIKKKVSVRNNSRNNFCLKVKFKHWVKLRSYYKSSLLTRVLFKQLFDSSVKLSGLIKDDQSVFHTKFVNFLVKPYYKLDILLWKLHFFLSCYEARQYINEGLVLVNNKKVKSNFFVKKGDVVQILVEKCVNSVPQKTILQGLCTKYDSVFLPFVEADYYSKALVIVKDLSELSKEDFYLLNTIHFDLKKLQN